MFNNLNLKKPFSFLFMSTAFAVGAMNSNATTEFHDSIISLQEIPVISIKSAPMQAFPSSVTNLSAETIERFDVKELKNVSEIAPNFYMPSYGSRMTSSIYVRGLGSRIDQPVISLSVDNVPLMSKDMFDFTLPDINIVQMARGPQNVLYGRNSMGGAVNVSTLSPFSYQGVKAVAEYGSGNSYRIGVSGYHKFTPQVAMSLSAAFNSTDGFFINEYTGNKVDKERQGLLRLKIGWKQSQSFMLENSAWLNMNKQGGYPYQSLETGKIAHNDTCFYNRTSVFDGLTMRYFAGNVSISSITGFQYINDNMTLDQDFLPEDYFTLTQKRHEWSVTQDFIASGKAGNYKYLGGLYGFYRRGDIYAPVVMKDYGIQQLVEGPANAGMERAGMRIGWDERSMLLRSDFRTPLWGFAVYHKSEYTIDRFTASLGLRLAYERLNLEYRSRVNTAYTLYRNVSFGTDQPERWIPLGQYDINIDDKGKLHQTALQLLPELKLSYAFSDAFNLGLVVSKGYKSGGYNTQMFSDILQQKLMNTSGHGTVYEVDDVISYKPELSWNYEIDARFSLLENKLDIDASLFYMDVTNQQMTVFPDGLTTGRMMTNAGKSRSIGFELSASYRPIRELSFVGSYGLADARFRRFDNGIIDCKGKHVPYAPENTMFLAATYSPKINHSFLTGVDFTVDCRGVGQIFWNEENTERQNFYATLGMSVTLKSQLFDLELWSRNMTDTKYAVFYFESIGHRFIQRANPTTTGVTLRFNIDL